MIIKVCGMRDPENIRAVEQLDVDWMGFIFYPESKRYVSDEEEVIQAICQCRKKKVGVFVNAETDEMREKGATFQLDMLQLHGEEPAEQCNQLRQDGFQVIKAFSIATADDLKQVDAYKEVVDYILFDTKCAGYGGSGERFDWSVLCEYQGKVPFLLSGGISADHLSDFQQFCHSQMIGVDVNSGFEIAPAVKDAKALRAFVQQVRNSNL